MDATASEVAASADTVHGDDRRELPVLGDRFEDLDDPEIYAKTKKLLATEATKNFVVEFGYDEVHIAFDLTEEEMDVLLATDAPMGMVRWINVWTPTIQAPVIGAIGDHYGFTRRLQAIMTMPSPEQMHKKDKQPRPSTSRLSISMRSPVSDKPAAQDIEMAPSVVATPPKASGNEASKDLAIYHLVKNTMGFTSVDQGDQFVCIGTNWLHGRGIEDSELMQPKHWSWFTLCSDHTVISIHETPRFESPDDLDLRQKELESMRSNTKSVLCQLSKLGHEEYKFNVISLKSVRELLKPDFGRVGTLRRTATDLDAEPRGNSNDVQTEGASNLFYYLFEDYGGAAPVLQASKAIIADLTHRVLSSADRRAKLKTKDIIPNLHVLRSQLRQLQNLFESYKKIIHRIARPRHITNNTESHSGPLRLSGDVKISQLARSRFERLEDRLQMLMLNAISECLEEQSALSQTYFNLTAQKDSQATARLTRSATLLAKLSVFFLPISFMTSYFSVEIPDLVEHYTPRTYWVSFAVIGGLSFIALFFFGRLLMFFSESLEDWSDRLFRKRREDAE